MRIQQHIMVIFWLSSRLVGNALIVQDICCLYHSSFLKDAESIAAELDKLEVAAKSRDQLNAKLDTLRERANVLHSLRFNIFIAK